MRNLEFQKFGSKNGICVENRTYVGTSFVGRPVGNEVQGCGMELL